MDKNELIKILKDDYKLLYQYDEKPVYLIENNNGDKFIAKCVDEHHFDEEKFQMWEKIDHPNITRIVDRINYIDQVIYIMSYLKGMTLFDYINEEGPMSESQAKLILSQLVDIFSYLHEFEGGLIYRDIHPKNILLHNEKAYLIDLDSTRIYKKNADFDTIAIGVIGFIAPEQYGFEQSSVQSDIYGLGVLISFLLTGKHPNFQQNKVFLDDLPISKDFKKLLVQMTAFNKKDRPQTMAVIRKRLEDRSLKLISKTSLMASILVLLCLSMSVYLYSQSIKPEEVKESNEDRMETIPSLEEDAVNPAYSETPQVLSLKETMDSYLVFNKTYESSVDNSVSLKSVTEEQSENIEEIYDSNESDSIESTEENEELVETQEEVSEIVEKEEAEVNDETNEVNEDTDESMVEESQIPNYDHSQVSDDPLLVKPLIDAKEYIVLGSSMYFNTIAEFGFENNNYSAYDLNFQSLSLLSGYDFKDVSYYFNALQMAVDDVFVYMELDFYSPKASDTFGIYQPENLDGYRRFIQKSDIVKEGTNKLYIKLSKDNIRSMSSIIALDIGDEHPALIPRSQILQLIEDYDQKPVEDEASAYGGNFISKSYSSEDYFEMADATLVSSFTANWQTVDFYRSGDFIDVEDIKVLLFKDQNYIYLGFNYYSPYPGGTAAFFNVDNSSGVFAKYSNHVVVGQNDYVLKLNRQQFESIIENDSGQIQSFGFDLREGSKAIVNIAIKDILN